MVVIFRARPFLLITTFERQSALLLKLFPLAEKAVRGFLLGLVFLCSASALVIGHRPYKHLGAREDGEGASGGLGEREHTHGLWEGGTSSQRHPRTLSSPSEVPTAPPPRLLQTPRGLEAEPYEAEDFVCDYHLEMLSLSQDQQNPSCIQFDDSNWQLHLTSLKPLGLNVLLNLCNASVTERLCRFSDHLCNIALQESHSAVLPVHVPWGLCELARLIGTRPPAPAGLVQGLGHQTPTCTRPGPSTGQEHPADGPLGPGSAA